MKIPAIIGLGTAVLVGAIVFFISVSRDDNGAVKIGPKAAAACTDQAPSCLPTVDFVDHEGQVFSASDLVGKVVIVNVWATWCHPCQAEMPELVKLREQVADKDVMLFGVLNDPGAAQTKIEGFLEQYHVNYPVIPMTDEIDQALDYPDKLPTTFIYGRDGRLLLRRLGGVTAKQLRQTIDAAL